MLIIDCTFERNFGLYAGVLEFSDGSFPNINRTTFTSNFALNSGIMRLRNSQIQVDFRESTIDDCEDCVFPISSTAYPYMASSFIEALNLEIQTKNITSDGFDYQFFLSGISRIGFYDNIRVSIRNKFLKLIDGARGVVQDNIIMKGPAANFVSVIGSTLSLRMQVIMSSTDSTHITMGTNDFLISVEQESEVEVAHSDIKDFNGEILFSEQSTILLTSANFSNIQSANNAELMTLDLSTIVVSS